MARNDVVVKITGDASGFKEATDDANSSLGNLGKGVGLAVAGLATIGVGAVVGLEKLGAAFDDAYDSIAIATGATGDTLAGLEQSFDDVLSSGPYAFDAVADAISGLHQRVDLTGQPLEDLSAQFLDLSRITDTDVASNIESLTQTMNKWGVPAEDMSATLDELFRASQASGISMEDLSAGLTKFGAPLSDLGFSLEDSAALFASFEESGVNADQAMAGLTKGLVNMAKDGEDAPETLERVIDQIANMEDPAEATALAVELFGSKAGPEMVAAIQSGAFEIEDYLDIIENGEGTISGTAGATDDWREKLQTLKNKVLVRLKPLAEKVFGAITAALTEVSDWFDDHADDIEAGFQSFIDVLKGIGDWLMKNKGVLIGALVALGGVVVGLFASWAAGAASAAIATIAALAPFIAIGVAVAAVGAAFVWAYENVEWFRDAVDAVADFLVNTVWPALVGGAQAVVDWFQVTFLPIVTAALDGVVAAALAVVDWFKVHWGEIKTIAGAMFDGVAEVVGAAIAVVKAVVSGIVDFVSGIVTLVRAVIDGDWAAAWDALKDIVATAWENIQKIVTLWLTYIGTIISKAWDVIKLVAGAAWDWVESKIGGVWDSIATAISWALIAVKSFLQRKWDEIKLAVAVAWDWISSKISGVWNAITTAINWSIIAIKGFLSTAWDSIKSVASTAWDAIKSTISSVWDGIVERVRTAIDQVWLHVASLPGRLWGLVLSVTSAAQGIGSAIVSGIASGVNSAVGAVAGIGSSLAEGIAAAFRSAWNAAAGRINNAIPNDITIGGWSVFGRTTPSVTIDLPDSVLPTFHDGGWVMGRSGDEVPALLQAGEYVMSRDELAGRRRPDSPFGGARGSVTVVNNNYGVAPTVSQMSDALDRARRAA